MKDLDSVIRGCWTWKGLEVAETIGKYRPDVFVTDDFDETANICISKGINILMLDTGNFPGYWYKSPPKPDKNHKDIDLLFTNFRSGWDQGNIATIIHENEILGDLPHDGYCDLQFFSMVQDANPLSVERVGRDNLFCDKQVYIRMIARLEEGQINAAIVQDPNALKELNIEETNYIAAENCAYLVELHTGKSRMVVCSLRLFDDPAGEYLLKNILEVIS